MSYDAEQRERRRKGARPYRIAHREEIRAKGRAYAAAHRDEQRAYQLAHSERERERKRAHYVSNREEIYARKRAQHAEHPERQREYNRAYQARNPGLALARVREWEARNPERAQDNHRRSLRAFRRRNPEQARAWARAWWATHPDAARFYQSRYRARKAGNGGAHTALEWRELAAAMGKRCAYCGALGAARSLHVEHRIPIARGGCDCISNVAPACGPCNLRKHTLTDREYIDRRRREGERFRVAILARPYCVAHSPTEAR